MPFGINSLFKIQAKGEEPVIVKIINDTTVFNKIKVKEIGTGKQAYLAEYLKGDVEIEAVSSLEIKKKNS
jgi:hypothetical protein